MTSVPACASTQHARRQSLMRHRRRFERRKTTGSVGHNRTFLRRSDHRSACCSSSNMAAFLVARCSPAPRGRPRSFLGSRHAIRLFVHALGIAVAGHTLRQLATDCAALRPWTLWRLATIAIERLLARRNGKGGWHSAGRWSRSRPSEAIPCSCSLSTHRCVRRNALPLPFCRRGRYPRDPFRADLRFPSFLAGRSSTILWCVPAFLLVGDTASHLVVRLPRCHHPFRSDDRLVRSN